MRRSLIGKRPARKKNLFLALPKSEREKPEEIFLPGQYQQQQKLFSATADSPLGRQKRKKRNIFIFEKK
jgi:hypothetical protein